MHLHRRFGVFLLLPASLCFPGEPVPPEAVAFEVQPRIVEMGAFFRGVTVRVRGVVGHGSRALVTVVGPDKVERFNRKGKFGPIWLNSGSVRISGVPSLFLLFSPEPVGTLLARDAIECHHLDARSLMTLTKVEPPLTDADEDVLTSFLALKSRDGSYRFTSGSVLMGEPESTGTRFSLEFTWPRTAPPATYRVHVYEVHEGVVLQQSSMPLNVVRVGFPSWLARLAEQRASLYGVMAVLISALAGFGIDFIMTRLFGAKRVSRH
jgi:hypothetical protein